MKPTTDISRIVQDIRILADAIDRRWKRGNDRHLTWGVKWDADRIARTADVVALRRCIAFALECPIGIRAFNAATRLDAVLRTIEKHQTEIEAQLRAA